MIETADHTLTLVLNGEATMTDVASAILGFHSLLDGLRREVAPRKRVEWKLGDVTPGSMRISAIGVAHRPQDAGALESVLLEFETLGGKLEGSRPLNYTEKVTRPLKRITDLMNGGAIPSIRLETAKKDYDVLPRSRAGAGRGADAPLSREDRRGRPLVSWGSVTGRIQIISMVNQLHFAIYDLRDGKPIYAYLEPGNESRMREIWGKIATVKGLLRRDPLTNRIVTVRRIDAGKIEIQREGPVNIMNLVGGFPRAKNGSRKRPEEIIRELRDAK